MSKAPYDKVPYPPFLPGTQNSGNTDTWHRRDTWQREKDDMGIDNKAADNDWRRNLDHFNGSRCGDQQRAEPTRKR